jgi:hypothetical protein
VILDHFLDLLPLENEEWNEVNNSIDFPSVTEDFFKFADDFYMANVVVALLTGEPNGVVFHVLRNDRCSGCVCELHLIEEALGWEEFL